MNPSAQALEVPEDPLDIQLYVLILIRYVMTIGPNVSDVSVIGRDEGYTLKYRTRQSNQCQTH